jgi:hypothetical protein
MSRDGRRVRAVYVDSVGRGVGLRFLFNVSQIQMNDVKQIHTKGALPFRQNSCQGRRVDSAICLLAAHYTPPSKLQGSLGPSPRGGDLAPQCTGQHELDECACLFTLHLHVP